MSDDSDYEMADDGYDELDPTQSQGGRKRANGTVAGYQLTNVLPLPRATTYSTQSLYDQIHAGDINLEPEYQRDVVWPESKQIGLIDSILRNFYVPPIIFVVHQHEDGSESKTCIDGKQRLTSLHRFMDGLIPHRDPTTNTKYWYKNNATTQSARGQLLPERYQRLFANKQVVCIEYQDLPDPDEREIFQRVQLGMALTPAEKLQVLNTPMAAFVRKLQSEYFPTGGPLDTQSLDWDRSRGGDFRCITQALYLIAKYPSSTSIGAIIQLEKWLRSPTSKPFTRSKGKKKAAADETGDDLSTNQAFLERIHATFHTFSRLVRDAALQAHFLRPEWRVSPIEFVMMCLLISVKMDTLTLEELAACMGGMRAKVRSEHLDIRMNARVAKTMFDYIEHPDPLALVPQAISEAAATTTATAANGAKRKREEQDVVLSGRKGKERKEGELVTPGLPSPASSVAPPRPDRFTVRKTIPPPRVTPPNLTGTSAPLR